MPGLWRNRKDTPEGKYLVVRRDDTIPKWPWFVLGASDPYAAEALYHYANVAERRGGDPDYVNDIRALAREFDSYRERHGDSCPADPPPENQRGLDNPDVVALMRGVKPDGGSA